MIWTVVISISYNGILHGIYTITKLKVYRYNGKPVYRNNSKPVQHYTGVQYYNDFAEVGGRMDISDRTVADSIKIVFQGWRQTIQS